MDPEAGSWEVTGPYTVHNTVVQHNRADGRTRQDGGVRRPAREIDINKLRNRWAVLQHVYILYKNGSFGAITGPQNELFLNPSTQQAEIATMP